MNNPEIYEINQNGFVVYPARHIGRMISVAGAIAMLEKPTSTSVVKYLGYLSKGNIDKIALDDLHYQLGIKVVKEGSTFRIESWGELINKKAALKYMKMPICDA